MFGASSAISYPLTCSTRAPGRPWDEGDTGTIRSGQQPLGHGRDTPNLHTPPTVTATRCFRQPRVRSGGRKGISTPRDTQWVTSGTQELITPAENG